MIILGATRSLYRASHVRVPKRLLNTTLAPCFLSLFRRKFLKNKSEIDESPATLSQDNLFHPLKTSPIEDLQLRADLITNHGLCPTCVDDKPPTPTPISPQELAKTQRPSFTCPDCGLPTHCSEQHYKKGLEFHKKYCATLRQINEDEHDLRSGRKFPEFKFPGILGLEAAVNLTNWDTFFVTRGFRGVDEERSVRHVSKLLTYPLTIASVLHPYGPHRKGPAGLTLEGSKSMAAINYTMEKQEPTPGGKPGEYIKQKIRIFIVGARAEGLLTPYAYLQLCYMFSNVSFQLYFIGPEATPPAGVPNKVAINPHLSFNYLPGLFQEIYHNLVPFDPYHDVFFLFSPGVAYPYTQTLWEPTLKLLLETKCPVFLTGYDQEDIDEDVKFLNDKFSSEMDWLLRPKLNEFRSLKSDFNLQDVRMTLQVNHSIMAIRGKRYEISSA